MASIPNEGDAVGTDDDSFKLPWNLQQDDVAKAIGTEVVETNIDLDPLDLVDNPSLWLNLDNPLSSSQDPEKSGNGVGNGEVTFADVLAGICTDGSENSGATLNTSSGASAVNSGSNGESPVVSTPSAGSAKSLISSTFNSQAVHIIPQASQTVLNSNVRLASPGSVTKVVLPKQSPVPMTSASSKGKQFVITMQQPQQGKVLPSVRLPSAAKVITWQQAQQLGISLPAQVKPVGAGSSSNIVKIVNTKPQSPLTATQKIVLRPSLPVISTASPSPRPAAPQFIRLTAAQALAAGLIPTKSGASTSFLNVVGNKVLRLAKPTAAESTSTIQLSALPEVRVIKQEPLFTNPGPSTVNVVRAIPAATMSTGGHSLLSPAKPLSPVKSTTKRSSPLDDNFAVPSVPKRIKPKIENVSPPPEPRNAAQSFLEANGIKPRRPCNCTKSHCLKMYCECFANGEFCNGCNCVCCSNNMAHETDRSAAVKSLLDRNPKAFKPKVGIGWGTETVQQAKGCHCKKSGCSKNYCECYEAKLACSSACRCIGCTNTGIKFGKLRIANQKHSQQTCLLARPNDSRDEETDQPAGLLSTRASFTSVTDEVVEATCHCLLAQAEEARLAGKDSIETEGLVLEEFGRCLLQIIDASAKAKGSLAL